MNKLTQITLTIIIAILMVSCSNSGEVKSISTQVIKHKYFPHLASASGIEFYGGKIYIIGDDLPFLFTLDENWNIIGKEKIAGVDSIVNGRTPKKLKADFESMALLEEAGEKQLLILSSGSKKTKRDTAFLISNSGNSKIHKKNMRPVYNAIKEEAGLKPNNKINIEGLAFSENKAYLLHRGNVSKNFIVEIEREALLAFIKSESILVPAMKVYPFNLPSDKGVAAGFSGACVLPEHSGLLFTASLENTSNEIDDGAVLGSYVGFVSFTKMNEGAIVAELITENGKTLQKKQEGITVKLISENKIIILTVCDNDDGSSDLYEIELKINEE